MNKAQIKIIEDTVKILQEYSNKLNALNFMVKADACKCGTCRWWNKSSRACTRIWNLSDQCTNWQQKGNAL